MNYVADGGGGGLTPEQVQQATVQEILSTLQECKVDLHPGQNLKAVPQHSFGGAPSAQTLGFHTSEAHNHVIQAIDQLMAGINAYDAGVTKFRKDVADTDETVSAPFRNAVKSLDVLGLFDAGAACATGPSPADYSTNDTCELPTGDS